MSRRAACISAITGAFWPIAAAYAIEPVAVIQPVSTPDLSKASSSSTTTGLKVESRLPTAARPENFRFEDGTSRESAFRAGDARKPREGGSVARAGDSQ